MILLSSSIDVQQSNNLGSCHIVFYFRSWDAFDTWAGNCQPETIAAKEKIQLIATSTMAVAQRNILKTTVNLKQLQLEADLNKTISIEFLKTELSISNSGYLYLPEINLNKKE